MTVSQWSLVSGLRVGTIAILLPLFLVGTGGRSIAAKAMDRISARQSFFKDQISSQLLAAGPQQQIERRTALVIGNGNYGSMGNLKNPSNDAEDVAKALKELGFEVTLLKDVEQKPMEDAIEKFNQRLRQQDSVGLFYYAGHGIQVGGENYLIPVGVKINREQEVRYKSIPLGQIIGAMEDAKNLLNIVILDACRDSSIIRRFRSTNERGLKSVPTPDGMFIAFSTASGDVSEDGEGRNSPYTSSLLEYIQEPGVPIQLTFERIRLAVRNKTEKRQSPRYESSIGGIFTFKPTESAISTLPSPILSSPIIPNPTVTEPTVIAVAPIISLELKSILRLVNEEREKAGLVPLIFNPLLNQAAQDHTNDMISKGYFSHTSPSGRTMVMRVNATGYKYSTIGENIAAGSSTAAATMTQWMNSPGHRANILNPKFKELGVGYGPSNDQYRYYWTQVFGTAR